MKYEIVLLAVKPEIVNRSFFNAVPSISLLLTHQHWP